MSKRDRQHHHARRHPRRGRSRRRAHDVPAAGHRLAADVRPRRRHAAVDGEPRVLRAVRARARRVDRAQGRRGRASRAGRSTTVDLALLEHEREEELLRALALYPDVVAEAAETRAPQKVTTWVRDFARAFHGFYRDCRVLTDDAELTQARLWLTEACRIGLANALGAARRAARPTRWRASTTTTTTSRRTRVTRRSTSRCCRRRRRSTPTGSVSIGGVDLVELAERVRHAAVRLRRGRAARAGAASTAPASARGVAYASKAFLCTAMARLVAEEGLDLDVATGGELHVALHAGFPAERIVFHGNNKSADELRAALAAGVGRIVVDSFDELDRARAARRRRARPRRAVHRARDARRRGAHARVHRDRHRRLEVRVRARQRRRARGGRRASSVDGRCGSPGCTATSGRRCSASTRSRARSTRWSASCAQIETDDAARRSTS